VATALILDMGDPETAHPYRVIVKESFDEVYNRVAPISPPTSSLEARSNFVYTLDDDRRIFIAPGRIAFIEEDFA
jgi:hypothetical protein